ncbi:hypothetical protein CGC58_04840 [Capnocytophaga stomatis]|uniref:Oligosaccharide repeat unit polymerase n=2 Tax=Capnocytophaga stomatis TaxID=1848904 RepID=A0A250FVQ5_9FLAO|nr:hypothetical protein CGC58_04840 [Capnocytophaga stomatis]
MFYKIFLLLKNSIVFNLFMIQALIRYCIMPYKVSTGEYMTGFHSSNGEVAIFLMLLEIFFIFVILNFVAQKQQTSFISRTSYIKPISSSIFIYSLLIALFSYIYISGYLSKVNLVWNLGSFVQKYVVDREELKDTGFAGVLFTPLKTIAAIFFIGMVYNSKKISINKKKYIYLMIIVMSSIFIIGTSRLSIIHFALPLLILVTFMLDKKSSKKLIFAFGLFIIPIILIASIAKFTRGEQQATTESTFSTSSLNAYFAGPGNVATGLDAYGDLVIKNHSLFFINDMIQNLPGLAKYSSDTYKTNVFFNKAVYGHSLVRDQIVPLSVSGVFHFGIFGGFLYAPLFLLISLYIERKSYKETFLGYKYVYITLSITLSMIFMLNIGSMYFAFAVSLLFIYMPFYIVNFFEKLKS